MYFFYYSAILLNDQTVSVSSFMLHKNPTNQVPPHTHIQHTGGVRGLCNVPEVAVGACAKYSHYAIVVHSMQHFRIPSYTQGNSYQEGETFKAVGSNRTCR
jgi:hypothetical protein